MWIKHNKYNILINEYGIIRDSRTGDYRDIHSSTHGYYITITENHKTKKLYIDALVMEIFGELPLSDDPYVIEHIDGCLTNNHIKNLRWKHDLNSNETYRNTRVMVNETGKIYDNIWVCSEVLDIPVHIIKMCLKHSYLKTKKGYTFTLID